MCSNSFNFYLLEGDKGKQKWTTLPGWDNIWHKFLRQIHQPFHPVPHLMGQVPPFTRVLDKKVIFYLSYLSVYMAAEPPSQPYKVLPN
jgi:hypothetical protein